MQAFRLVKSGAVDRVIAFDELPKRFLNGVEMRPPDGLPRHWKSFLGEQAKHTPSSLEKNQMTGAIEKVGEKTEVGPFFYVLNYKEINKDMERWQEICNFVRRVVSLHFRLMDKIEDMALPFAVDAMAEIKLEPENLEEQGALIPIPLEFQEKTPAVIDKNGKEVRTDVQADESAFKCERCDNKQFKNEQALKMHTYRKHPAQKEAKQEVKA